MQEVVSHFYLKKKYSLANAGTQRDTVFFLMARNTKGMKKY